MSCRLPLIKGFGLLTNYKYFTFLSVTTKIAMLMAVTFTLIVPMETNGTLHPGVCKRERAREMWLRCSSHHWLKDRSYRSRWVCGRYTLNLRHSPVRLELRKSQDYRSECEPEGTTQLGRQPVFHLSLPPQEAGEREKILIKSELKRGEITW